MGTNTLDTVANSNTSDANNVNQFSTALRGDIIPRKNADGTPDTTITNSLGTPLYPWKDLYIGGSIVVNGQVLNIEAGERNQIVSSRSNANGMPDFVRATGASTVQILADVSNPLRVVVDGTPYTLTANITSGGSLTAAPAINNAWTITDAAGTAGTLFRSTTYGEIGCVAGATGGGRLYQTQVMSEQMLMGTIGSEITNRTDSICSFIRSSGTDVVMGWNYGSGLRHCKSGFFIDSAGALIARQGKANSNVYLLLNTGWVFLNPAALTITVSYKDPIYSPNQPASPATNDYWYDTINEKWKRWNGSAFVIETVLPVGWVLVNSSGNSIASRSFDLTKKYERTFSGDEPLVRSVDVMGILGSELTVSVYGKLLKYKSRNSYNFTLNTNAGLIQWNFNDPNIFDVGTTRAINTLYHLYITPQGQPKISTTLAHYRQELQGWYHPFANWRCVGEAITNATGSGNFISQQDNYNISLNSLGRFPKVWLLEGSDGVGGQTSGTWYRPYGSKTAKVICIGGGGGSNTGGAQNGATSQFGTLIQATGGTVLGVPGVGQNGDVIAHGTFYGKVGRGDAIANFYGKGGVLTGDTSNGGYAEGTFSVNNINSAAVNVGNGGFGLLNGVGGVVMVTTYGENFFP
jgi:hypothetical protein